LDQIDWDQFPFFIGGKKRKKKDTRRKKKKFVLIPAYMDVGRRSLDACSQPAC
jgi:hypothetical protein